MDAAMKTTPLKEHPEYQPIERLLSEKKVGIIDSLSKPTRWRERKSGNYPDPVRISKGRKGYPESKIRAWVAAKIKAAEKAVQKQEAADEPAS